MTKNSPRVSVIILNWNGWKDTIECLESVFSNTYSNYEVILVDNGSNDNSFHEIYKWANEYMKNRFEYLGNDAKRTRIVVKTKYVITKEVNNPDLEESNIILYLLRSGLNLGFAMGNNLAIQKVIDKNISKYVLLLNNDTVVNKNFMMNMVRKIESGNGIAVVGAVSMKYDNRNVYDVQYKYLNANSEVRDVCGVCALYSINKLLQVGLFNPNFFVYSEETELNIRLRIIDMKLVIAKNAIVFHKTSISSKKISGLQEYYRTRNVVLTYLLHSKFLGIFWVISNLLKIYIKQVVFVNKFRTSGYYVHGLIDGITRNYLNANNIFRLSDK